MKYQHGREKAEIERTHETASCTNNAFHYNNKYILL